MQYFRTHFLPPTLTNGEWSPLLHIEGVGNSLDFYRALADYVLNLRTPQGPVLDIGCATGRLMGELLARIETPAYGLDVNAASLVHAYEYLPKATARLARADATSLPIATESVDVALLINLLDRVHNPEIVLAECGRVTHQGGLLVVASTHDWAHSPEPALADRIPDYLRRAGFRRESPATDLVWMLPDAMNSRHVHVYRVEVEAFVRS
ncbi:class I SAM-dependent methyltransferase [Mycolicibacterium sp. 120266]|uniref:class I SAM-dependent methyltransferase n=1 Tax=Mycolicibacterium sp. 120266 TaxID=3090601 RepID=UPI0039A5CBCE